MNTDNNSKLVLDAAKMLKQMQEEAVSSILYKITPENSFLFNGLIFNNSNTRPYTEYRINFILNNKKFELEGQFEHNLSSLELESAILNSVVDTILLELRRQIKLKLTSHANSHPLVD